ncbi:MAG: hypothetical protein ACFFD4_33980 [Candidatus Odinarchaeota archaeon]
METVIRTSKGFRGWKFIINIPDNCLQCKHFDLGMSDRCLNCLPSQPDCTEFEAT